MYFIYYRHSVFFIIVVSILGFVLSMLFIVYSVCYVELHAYLSVVEIILRSQTISLYHFK